ncbi:MAG: hypothetical protein GXO75_02395 [Calditrichaeota bacterium]|nr:hypothetical protein [Calditrichota bacterium]
MERHFLSINNNKFRGRYDKERYNTDYLMLHIALPVSNLMARELLSDGHFQNGLRVKAPHMPVTFLDTLQFHVEARLGNDSTVVRNGYGKEMK